MYVTLLLWRDCYTSQIMSHENKKLVLPLRVNFWPQFGKYRVKSKRGAEYLRFDFSKEQRNRAPENAINPWTLRSDFLMSPDAGGLDLESFAHKYGCFAERGVLTGSAAQDSEVRIASLMAEAEEGNPIGWDYLEQWRDFVRKLLLTPRQDWQTLEKQYGKFKLRTALNFAMRFTIEYDSSSRPYAVITVPYALNAILATIQIDMLDGLEFRECARPDCNAPPFKRTSGHERKYCSEGCAHLEAVRAHRSRQTTAGENRKRKAAPQDKIGGTK